MATPGSPPVAVDGPGDITEVMVCVAEAVPGGDLAVAVAETLQQVEGMLTVSEGALVVAE